jgi:hypothetical protein
MEQMRWTSTAALEKLAAELAQRGYEAKLIAPEGREPWLVVRNPHAASRGQPRRGRGVVSRSGWAENRAG